MTFDSSFFLIAAVAAVVILILAFLAFRPRRQRIETDRKEGAEPYVAATDRPYVKARERDWVTDEVAAATTDIAGEVLGVDAHRELDPATGEADDLQRLKGVGPKFVTRLHELGISRYAQLASLGADELAMLDDRLGPFRGRLARDRIAEQADYLSRGDTDGFEERFGKLGG